MQKCHFLHEKWSEHEDPESFWEATRYHVYTIEKRHYIPTTCIDRGFGSDWVNFFAPHFPHIRTKSKNEKFRFANAIAMSDLLPLASVAERLVEEKEKVTSPAVFNK